MDDNFEFKIGMNIGLRDVIDYSPNMVEWYTILAIEPDDEFPMSWIYLKSETDKLNNKQSVYGNYARIIESVSDRFILE